MCARPLAEWSLNSVSALFRLAINSRQSPRHPSPLPPRRRPICRPTTELIHSYTSHRPNVQKILPQHSCSRNRRHRRLLARALSRLSVAVIIDMTTVFVSPARRPLFERIAGLYTHSEGPHWAPKGRRASRARRPTSLSPSCNRMGILGGDLVGFLASTA